MEEANYILDKSKPIPAYFQIEEFIQEKIERNEWPAGSQIPTEKELCNLLGVSRSVIRQAMGSLINQGLVKPIPGKGTFVCKPKISEGLIQSLTGFYEDMTGRGMVPHTEVLKKEKILPPGKIARLLNIKNGDEVYLIERLRGITEEDHLSLSTTYIPCEFAPDLIDQDLTKKSLYEVLMSYGLRISYADRIIEAIEADEETSKLLNIKINSPLLVITNISYLEDGTPIEYFIAKHSGLRSKLKVRLAR